jgi:phage/plasmid-associated DNA primase
LVEGLTEQGEVAVVMRGIEGCGKGTLAKVLLHILGQHGVAISNTKHLTGNFNGHLRDTVLLFADEAFHARDKAHVGVLKALITEPTLAIEAKFQNAVQMPNYVHLMMASNEDWVIPASLEARRFLVLKVLASMANNTAYFAAIWGK